MASSFPFKLTEDMFFSGAGGLFESPKSGGRVTQKKSKPQVVPPVKKKQEEEKEIFKFASLDSSYDSDDDYEPSTPAYLDWRKPPSESFSDWTLEVSSGKPNSTMKYHVHKSMLILESEYFQKRFGQGKIFDKSSTTKMVFQEKAAVVFPQFLDYIYSHGKIKLTTSSAVAFHFFGRFFGMKRLRWEAKQFWQNDLTFETVARYYEDAIIFNDHKIMTGVKVACTQPAILLQIQKTSAILAVPDPQLLLHIVEQVGALYSEHLSVLVASFCYGSNIAADTFLRLVAERSIPVVSFEAAFLLLEEERNFLGKSREVKVLSSLQKRCILALEKRWQDIDASSEKFSAFLAMQSPLFLAELLKRTLAASQANMQRSSGQKPEKRDDAPVAEKRDGAPAAVSPSPLEKRSVKTSELETQLAGMETKVRNSGSPRKASHHAEETKPTNQSVKGGALDPEETKSTKSRVKATEEEDPAVRTGSKKSAAAASKKTRPPAKELSNAMEAEVEAMIAAGIAAVETDERNEPKAGGVIANTGGAE